MPKLLDTKDKKILYHLDMDARIPLSILSKRVGLSREVVYYRIKQLEKKGIIENYYTVIDITKLEQIYCRIFLKYRTMTHENEQKLLVYCKQKKNIPWVALGEGKWDITIVIIAKNLPEIEKTYDELNAEFGNYFQNPYVTIAFSINHFKHNYLYGTDDHTDWIVGENKKVEIDEIDTAILRLLSTNARTLLTEIAKKLKLTPKRASYRIKRMLKEKLILGYRTKINTRLLGFDHYKVFLTVQNFNTQNQKKLNTYLRMHPAVIYITKPLGTHNLEFEIMVKGTNELHECVRELKIRFADIIIDYDTMLNYAEPLLGYITE